MEYVYFFLQSAKEKIYWSLRAMELGQEAILQAKEKLVEAPFWPSSCNAGCWCGHTCCGSGQRGAVGKHNTCSRSSCRSCISEWVGKGKAQWCCLAHEAPSAGQALSGYCDLTECCHPPAVCLWKSDAANQAGCPPCLGF